MRSRGIVRRISAFGHTCHGQELRLLREMSKLPIALTSLPLRNIFAKSETHPDNSNTRLCRTCLGIVEVSNMCWGSSGEKTSNISSDVRYVCVIDTCCTSSISTKRNLVFEKESWNKIALLLHTFLKASVFSKMRDYVG